MSAFTEVNVPGGNPGASSRAAIEYAKAYATMQQQLSAHLTETAGAEGVDPHGIKAYINAIENKAKDTANCAKNKANVLESVIAGKRSTGISSAQYLINSLGADTDVILFVKGLATKVAELEAELNTLSLLQFDNVPVGAGIRWWKDTLPEDGTYVWANGQTLYGVNQNFPELARVWDLDSSGNVQVPKEDNTIFKVRKATKKIHAIEHAYIDEVSGTATTVEGLSSRITELSDMLESIQGALEAMQNTGTEGTGA